MVCMILVPFWSPSSPRLEGLIDTLFLGRSVSCASQMLDRVKGVRVGTRLACIISPRRDEYDPLAVANLPELDRQRCSGWALAVAAPLCGPCSGASRMLPETLPAGVALHREDRTRHGSRDHGTRRRRCHAEGQDRPRPPRPAFVGVGKTIEVGAIPMLPSEQEQMSLIRRLS